MAPMASSGQDFFPFRVWAIAALNSSERGRKVELVIGQPLCAAPALH
jgi:hypothetical protein